MDGACATDSHATSVLGPGKLPEIAQYPQKRYLRISFYTPRNPIHVDSEKRHTGFTGVETKGERKG
jgi:hypothetical protein